MNLLMRKHCKCEQIHVLDGLGERDGRSGGGWRHGKRRGRRRSTCEHRVEIRIVIMSAHSRRASHVRSAIFRTHKHINTHTYIVPRWIFICHYFIPHRFEIRNCDCFCFCVAILIFGWLVFENLAVHVRNVRPIPLYALAMHSGPMLATFESCERKWNELHFHFD